ncbi:peptidoglycan editing factor PgeF [Motiliproteus sp. MSK22-1]|uniref:peptidoglycan editing factor PgeF n=1 Tax=Motiliproteus sp. MSK22-1 TaxID=1897630 RepID=UPI000978B876|nr:peptidoglycan editing factor PgeF [Motiliproteus sp. MSK22-1]OMH28394.1 hypothetical protein BGP75_21070 [Motiliproteus sp. MSK22-1]
MEHLNSPLIVPDWPAPETVRAVSSTRLGGFSDAPYNSFNLGQHVGDDADKVIRNRSCLSELIGSDVAFQWLEQVHGTEVVSAQINGLTAKADASFTRDTLVACLVMTADCLPVLFCDRSGTRVAAAHAGWRGLADGVLEATVKALKCPAEDILCWFGPAIGPGAFEVGGEVRQRFCDQYSEAFAAFKPLVSDQLTGQAAKGTSQKWLADLYSLARLRLAHIGVTSVYGGDYCTFSDAERFFSYRRDGVTGRMASLVWLDRS